jgi:glycosyltransferase involved in cell wall biosynthesis
MTSLTDSPRVETPVRAARPRPAGVILQTPLQGTSPASQEGRAVARALSASGLPVRLAEVPEEGRCAPETQSAFEEQLEPLLHTPIDVPHSVLYYAGDPLRWNLEVYGIRRVGRLAFGGSRLPEAWEEPCQAMDELWLASENQRQSCANAGLPAERLRVLPSGVDTALFHPNAPRLEVPGARGCNFLSVANLQERQGDPLLLRAFAQEFGAEEDVALWVKIAPHAAPASHLAAELAFFLEREVGLPLERCPQIVLVNEPLSPAAMASLYASADVFVRPFHASLRAQALLEALASGLAVLAPRADAAADFVGEESVCSLALEKSISAPASQDFASGAQWAQPSLPQLRLLLREIFERRAETRERGLRARQEIVAHRDWSVILPQWVQAFRELLA